MMSQSEIPFQKLRAAIAIVAAMGLMVAGCKKASQTGAAFKMGERIEVGGLIYTVLESDWRSQLGEGASAQVPKHRFLLIKMTVTNTGGQQRDIPLLHIENAKKEQFMELAEVKDVPGWMGMIRLMPPSGIEEGWIVFDAPPGSYNLRVVSREGEDEIARYVEIPLTLKDDPVKM